MSLFASIPLQSSVLEINFLAGSKYLLPGIKGSSKTNVPSSKHWWPYNNPGPVFQSIVSLTSPLRGQLVKCITTLYPNTLIFFVEKLREALFLHCKSFSRFFNKNIVIHEILMFEILMKG